jgi:hypothetical protein
MQKLLLPVLLSTVACTSVESDDILTSGIYADIAARADGGGTTLVTATLFLGNPINLNFIDLTGDDQLIASYGDQDKVMIETKILGTVSYSAAFQGGFEGDEFVVALLRNVDGGAPESIATLPEEFEIDPIGDPGPGEMSRAQELMFTWGPAGSSDQMSWVAEGVCIERVGAPLASDTGTATIPRNTLVQREGAQIPETCEVTITMTRSRLGSLDPGYGKGGEITGEQVRTVTFTSTP